MLVGQKSIPLLGCALPVALVCPSLSASRRACRPACSPFYNTAPAVVMEDDSTGEEAVTASSARVGEHLQTRTDELWHLADAPCDEMSKAKARAIAAACDVQDLEAVIGHATSAGGLLTDHLRQRACEYMYLTICLEMPPPTDQNARHLSMRLTEMCRACTLRLLPP